MGQILISYQMVTTTFQRRTCLWHISEMAGLFRQPRRNLSNRSIKLSKLRISSLNYKQKYFTEFFSSQNDMPPKWGKPPPSTFNLEENIQIVSSTSFSCKNKC